MTVYEIKDPKPVPASEVVKSRRRDIKPVSPATAVKPIDSLTLKREWHGNKRERSLQEESDSGKSLATAQAVINLINDHLEAMKRGIHIALKDSAGGYVLDVHDCSNGKICDKVAEMPIIIEDLPILLKKLQQEAGILLDKKL